MTDNHSKSNNLTGITVLYFLGAVLGTALYCYPSQDKTEPLRQFSEELINGRLSGDFSACMVNSFCGPFILLLICFFLGLSAAAQPAELSVPMFHGFGTGVSLAGIYDIYGLKGMAAAAVLVLPSAVVSAFAVIIAARESLSMSGYVYQSAFGKKNTGNADFRLYFTKFVILCAIVTAAAFAESVLSFFFAKLLTVYSG